MLLAPGPSFEPGKTEAGGVPAGLVYSGSNDVYD